MLHAICARVKGDGIKIDNAMAQEGRANEFFSFITFFFLFSKSKCCTGVAQSSGRCDAKHLDGGFL